MWSLYVLGLLSAGCADRALGGSRGRAGRRASFTVADARARRAAHGVVAARSGPIRLRSRGPRRRFTGISSPAIARDGTLYAGSRDGNFYALSAAGETVWKVNVIRMSSSPSVGSDGTIYFTLLDGEESDEYQGLYALAPSGAVKWTLTTTDLATGPPCLAADGTIYVVTDDAHLYAADGAGHTLWRATIGNPTPGEQVIDSAAAIAPDGTIYVPSGDKNLYAFDPSGATKWSHAMGGFPSSVTVGTDGTIYVGSFESQDDGLHAISPSGTEKWTVPIPFINEAPALAADGTIYAASDNQLYAVTPDGAIAWVYTATTGLSAPVLGADGTLYVGSTDSHVYAIHPDGTQAWAATTDAGAITGAIASDGTLYVALESGSGVELGGLIAFRE